MAATKAMPKATSAVSSMGFSQKIFYYHVPIAETALVAFGIAFVAAIAYLRTQNLKWDRLGVVCVRLGLLFSLLVMITGMIWGKAAWDVWWAWEPRLTTFLLVCFLYIAYLVLRSVVEEEQRRATYAAVMTTGCRPSGRKRVAKNVMGTSTQAAMPKATSAVSAMGTW